MSDNQSHEFDPPDSDELETEIVETVWCFSCGDIFKDGTAPASCPECGEDWCYDCIDEHAKSNPRHFQTF